MRAYCLQTFCACFAALAMFGCSPDDRVLLPDAEATSRAALGHCELCPVAADDIDPADGAVHYELIAEQTDNGGWLFAYNGQNPGPTLHANVGDRVVIDFTNRLGEPSTVHWHGMHVPFAMDGVAWMGSPVADGESFRYEFDATAPGTFWYHPHFNTNAQVEGGLFGAIIVSDPDEPEVDEDIVLFIDDGGEPLDGHPAHGHGALSRDWEVNGAREPVLAFEAGTVVRARFINVASAAYAALQWSGMEQIASDQGLLAQLGTPERVVLGPSDRAEFVWRLGEDGFTVSNQSYSLNGGDTAMDGTELLTVSVEGSASIPAQPDWAFSGAEPTPDPSYADIVYVFAGSDRTGEWRINGELFPEVTIEEIPLGSTAIIEVRNLSPTEHPFHLHGMAFEVLSVNGVPPAYRTIEDSLNVRIRETVRLRLEATNPGDWMAHCHILPHSEDGMMTVLRVTE